MVVSIFQLSLIQICVGTGSHGFLKGAESVIICNKNTAPRKDDTVFHRVLSASTGVRRLLKKDDNDSVTKM